MEAVSSTLRANACFPEDVGTTPTSDSKPYTVKSGDTLSKIAARLQKQGLKGSPEQILQQLLTLNPQLTDPNKIEKGATLHLPSNPNRSAPSEEAQGNHLERFVSREPPAQSSHASSEAVCREPMMTIGTLLASLGTSATSAPTFRRANGTAFPTSADGTPMYKQSDTEWGATKLGSGDTPKTIAARGCAMSSVAMALSKLSGETITPGVLDSYLDTNSGYVGNSLKWATAGHATQPPISVTKTASWNLDTINASLDAGRPVVLGVDYKPGDSGGTLGTDHWVCLTRRDPKDKDVYYANDPATGGEVCFRKQPDGTLKQAPMKAGENIPGYRSSGEFATFSKMGTT